MTKRFVYGLVLALGIVAYLGMPAQMHASALLVSASPAPNQTLDRSPREVRLTFNTQLVPATSSLTVVDAVGVHVDLANGHVLAADPKVLTVSLPRLEEGLYTVTYTATDSQTEITTSDSYQFFLDFPTPQVRLSSPPNGAGFEMDVVRVEVDTGGFDLDYWDHDWRLYLDGEPIVTSREPTHILRGLDEGVHELRVVLVDPDETEVHSTRSTTFIAIGRIDPEQAEIAAAALAPGNPGLTLSAFEGVLLALVVTISLGLGVFLAHRARPDATEA